MVVEYVEICRKLRKMDTRRLDQWSQQAGAGKLPDSERTSSTEAVAIRTPRRGALGLHRHGIM